ncbi:2Fe-2S iron-sulfur cluster-binding protein, partial [Acinetobacter baumannii]
MLGVEAAPQDPGARPARTDAPVLATVTFTVNGERRTLELDTRTSLLDAAREHLHLTGSKKGCDHGQ